MPGHLAAPIRALLAASLFLGLASPLTAQESDGGDPTPLLSESAPTIRGVLRSSELLLDRLQTMMSLTSPEDQKQFKTLKEYINIFLVGVDKTKPVRMDIVTLKNSTMYRLSVPIAEGKILDFRKFNLYPSGIPTQQYTRQPNLYRLGFTRNATYSGYMLYAPDQRGGYATISTRSRLLPPADGPSPVEGVQELLQGDFDVALLLRNEPEGVEQRHARFSADKAQVLSELQRQAEESDAEFALRKFAAGVQFDQVERIYAEAKRLIAGLSISENPARGRIEFTLQALPGTSLAKAIARIGQEPSRFANVPVPEEATSSGRIHLPLGDFQTEKFLALSQQFLQTELAEAASIEGASPEQKAATKKFLKALFAQIDAGIKAGVIDAFMNMTKNEEGIYTVVGGAVSPNASKWVDILQLTKGLKNPPTFNKDVGTIGEVTLHEIIFPEGKNPSYEQLFGGRRLLIGTGKDTVWYAAGPNAKAALTKAIQAAQKPGEARPILFTFHGELLPAFKILDQRRGEKGRTDLRQRAIETFTNGQGQVDMEVVRQDDELQGTIVVDSGVLRLIGATLAEISRENLVQ